MVQNLDSVQCGETPTHLSGQRTRTSMDPPKSDLLSIPGGGSSPKHQRPGVLPGFEASRVRSWLIVVTINPIGSSHVWKKRLEAKVNHSIRNVEETRPPWPTQVFPRCAKRRPCLNVDRHLADRLTSVHQIENIRSLHIAPTA